MSTKGSHVESATNPSGGEDVDDGVPTMGFYVQCDHSTCLVALRKVYDGESTIHNVSYADDVVRVIVEKVYDSYTLVPFPTTKIQYVKQTLDTFVAWPSHLVKLVSHEVFFLTCIKTIVDC